MKSILIFAGIAGVALAGTIVYFKNKMTGSRQILNVEDGFPMNA